MRRKRLLWRLYPSYLAVTLLALTAVGWFAVWSVHGVYVDFVRARLSHQAVIADRELGDEISFSRQAEIQAQCERLARLGGLRVTLLLPDGRVLCETSEDPRFVNDHADRPEFQEALAEGDGFAMRYSNTVHEHLVYAARRLSREGATAGVLRVSMPVTAVESAISAARWRVFLSGLAVAAFSALVCLLVARRLSRPLEEMRLGAERFASGDLGYKLRTPDSEELASLAEALNLMAGQLEERIGAMVRQRSQQEAVLSSMDEGVLAVNAEERVILMNRAAAELLQCAFEPDSQRTLAEQVRQADVRRFVEATLRSTSGCEKDLVIHGEAERILQARGAVWRDAGDAAAGAVVVLDDVTDLRRLETMRRDFVANVSHELKTPITSIKGFVETLLDGASRDDSDRERFLRIILKQADRLNAIIEDLLSLSKIEQSESAADLDRGLAPLDAMLDAALLECQPKAADRQVTLRRAGRTGLQAWMNPALLEQAVVNLLDNAIKYSEPGREVVVELAESPREFLIRVVDHGCGIEEEHLARVFERFYRVDKARSRKLGGTGLGLAIVKHIVQVHGGRVSVESAPGQGSTFTIHLPRDVEPRGAAAEGGPALGPIAAS